MDQPVHNSLLPIFIYICCNSLIILLSLSLSALLLLDGRQPLDAPEHLRVLFVERVVAALLIGGEWGQFVFSKILRDVGLRLQVPPLQLPPVLLALVKLPQQLIPVRHRHRCQISELGGLL